MQNNSKSNSLNKLIHEEILRQIPLMVSLIILCITGIAGNILVCYFHTKKITLSTLHIFASALGAADLFISSVIIPLELLQLAWQYTFSNVTICKLTSFVKTWATIVLILLVLCIAADRYRKVCMPFRRQLSVRAAWSMCFGCAFLGVAFAWISPVIYNIQTKELDVYNVTISECAITESMKKTVFPLLNNVSLASLFVGALTGIITFYTRIAKRVNWGLTYVGYTDSKKHTVPDGNKSVNASESNTPEISDSDFFEQGNRRRKTEIEMQIARGRTERWKTYITVTDNASDINASKALNAEFGVEGERRQTKRINIGTRNTYSKKKENDKVSKGKITTTGDAFKTPNITILDALEKKPNEACKSKKSTPMRRSIRFRTRRIKLSLFLYSLACIVSYLPLLLILLIVNADKALTDSERAAYNFFHRSYLLHCAVNPIICGIIDVRFRKFCKMKLLCRKHEIIYEL